MGLRVRGGRMCSRANAPQNSCWAKPRTATLVHFRLASSSQCQPAWSWCDTCSVCSQAFASSRTEPYWPSRANDSRRQQTASSRARPRACPSPRRPWPPRPPRGPRPPPPTSPPTATRLAGKSRDSGFASLPPDKTCVSALEITWSYAGLRWRQSAVASRGPAGAIRGHWGVGEEFPAPAGFRVSVCSRGARAKARPPRPRAGKKESRRLFKLTGHAATKISRILTKLRYPQRVFPCRDVEVLNQPLEKFRNARAAAASLSS